MFADCFPVLRCLTDGIHFGGQVLVVALGFAEGGEKRVLGVWQGVTENTAVVTTGGM